MEGKAETEARSAQGTVLTGRGAKEAGIEDYKMLLLTLTFMFKEHFFGMDLDGVW